MRIALAVGLLAAGLVVTTPAAAPAHAGERDGAAPLSRLHATTGRHPGIIDERGARVLLSGVNVNGLGEYFQASPDFAPTVPLGREDFEQIATLGFNSVRLIVSWSRLEPTRGAYDTAYVDRIRTAVDQAAANGLYVVLDMHQDAWGLAVDTPLGETCPRGSTPNNGWDGAPAWATITDGATTCRTGERELVPAVEHAWKHFYADTDGIQTELVKVWGKLARDFASDPAVAGFDLLNEPGFGPAIGTETAALGRFYGRTIKRIRQAETRAGGFHHIAFFEPGVLWSALGSSAVPTGFTKDANIVFAPHVYAGSISGNSIENGFRSVAEVAKAYGVTAWVGEWGNFSTDPDDDAGKLDRFTDAQDRYGYGGAWWDWKQACGDPHVIHQPGGLPDPLSPSLIRYACPSQEPAAAPDPAYAEALFRPLPRAVPGTIARLRSDGRTGTLDLVGVRAQGQPRCGLRVFVPAVWADRRLRTDGIGRLRTRIDHGNTIISGCGARRYRLRLG